MARIREAQIGDDGEVRIARPKGAGVLRMLLALALVAGGVWAFDAAYGERRPSVQTSGAASNQPASN